ncbi:MAG: hypothetical protein U9Q83_09760 [Bacteroidota bacterium]|nr:hypothetical protein [Bacteroidota bacterium]
MKIFISMNFGQLTKLVLFSLGFVVVLVISAFLIFSEKSELTNPGGIDIARKNYGKEVTKYSKKYSIPSAYMMSLIMLESSGREHIKPRFENHVYQKLLKLKKGEISRFENLTSNDLKGFSKNEIRDLAKSYGPFQIMGYKAISLGISVYDFEGDNSIKYGALWINREYGDLLRNGKFMDAFHLHNTGRVYPKNGKPKTHNPNYVKNGMEFMRYFSLGTETK